MYRIGTILGGTHGAEEAIDTALQVVHTLDIPMERQEFDLGADRYRRTGELLTPQDVAQLRTMDALLCGSPLGGSNPGIPPGVLERGLLFGLRRELELGVNLRVFRALGNRTNADVAVVRENSEGLYSGEGTVLHPGSDAEFTAEVSVATYHATQRCARYAFDLAHHRRRLVTLAHKRAVLTASGALWDRVVQTLATQYPEVTLVVENVDALCARLVTDPERYDVIVTDTLFGDIVADVAGAATGSLDRSGSAELTTASTGPSLFEPVHTPLGTGQPVNPLGVLTAVAMMLDNLGQRAASSALGQATLIAAASRPRRARLADTVTADARELLALSRDRDALPHAGNGRHDHAQRIVPAPRDS